jgi:NADH-quinone oxidoreductase subunit D
MYTSMESLYHCNGWNPIPVAEIYHPVEGGNGELGFYLVTDGVVTRIDYILEDLFLFTIKLPDMIKGVTIYVIVILSNVIAGELDA